MDGFTESGGLGMNVDDMDSTFGTVGPVSYTHLDVYKRQGMGYAGRSAGQERKATHELEVNFGQNPSITQQTLEANGFTANNAVSYTHLDVYKRQGHH